MNTKTEKADRAVYPSTRPLIKVKAQGPDGELTTTYQYNNDVVVLDEYQKFANKMRRRSWKQLIVKRKRLRAEKKKFCRLFDDTTISSRSGVIEVHIDVIEKLQDVVEVEIERRGGAAKGIRQGCS